MRSLFNRFNPFASKFVEQDAPLTVDSFEKSMISVKSSEVTEKDFNKVNHLSAEGFKIIEDYKGVVVAVEEEFFDCEEVQEKIEEEFFDCEDAQEKIEEEFFDCEDEVKVENSTDLTTAAYALYNAVSTAAPYLSSAYTLYAMGNAIAQDPSTAAFVAFNLGTVALAEHYHRGNCDYAISAFGAITTLTGLCVGPSVANMTAVTVVSGVVANVNPAALVYAIPVIEAMKSPAVLKAERIVAAGLNIYINRKDTKEEVASYIAPVFSDIKKQVTTALVDTASSYVPSFLGRDSYLGSFAAAVIPNRVRNSANASIEGVDAAIQSKVDGMTDRAAGSICKVAEYVLNKAIPLPYTKGITDINNALFLPKTFCDYVMQQRASGSEVSKVQR